MDYLNTVEMVGMTGRRCLEEAISVDVTRVVFNVRTEESGRGFCKDQDPSITKIPVSVVVYPGGRFQDFVFRKATPIHIVGKLVQSASSERVPGILSSYYVMLSAAEYILNEEEGSL